MFFDIRNYFLKSEIPIFWYQKIIFWYQKIGFKVPFGVPYTSDITGQIRQNIPSRIQSLLLLCIGLHINPNRLYDLAHNMWYTWFKMNTHCIAAAISTERQPEIIIHYIIMMILGTRSALVVLCVGNSSVESPHKGLVMRIFDFSLLLTWTSCLTTGRSDERRYDVTTMQLIGPAYCEVVYPAGTRRNNNVFSTSSPTSCWRSEDVIFASLLLRYVPVG